MNTTPIQNFQIRTDLWYDPVGGFWLDITDNVARIGLSPLTQETIGYFVALQLNAAGSEVNRGESFGSTEAEKHVGQLYSPVSGRISRVNEKALENPRLLNSDPYAAGWLVEIEMTRFDEEKIDLIHGEKNVVNWFETEIEKLTEKGWLTQP